MPTLNSHSFKTARTATPSETFFSLQHRLSNPFLTNNHSASIPSFSSTSPLSSSLSLVPWNFKTKNPLAMPLTVQARSSLDTTSERMPFISHSWTSASFLDVEAVAPKESDPFFEKRDLAQLQKLMVAITKERMEFKKTGSPLKTALRVTYDSMADDDMVSDHDSNSDDEVEDGDCKSIDLVDDAANTNPYATTDADAGADSHHGKKDQVLLSNAREGAGTPETESVGTATYDITALSKERGTRTCDCSKVAQGIDKLAQGISTLMLLCSHAHIHAHRKVNDAAIAAMNRVPSPVLERGYQGSLLSPSSPSLTLSPRAKDNFVSSAAAFDSDSVAASDSAASVAQAPTPQNNGVTVKGSLVSIKLPKTTRTVVMPKGHTSDSILLPPITLTTAEEGPSQVDEEEVKEGGAAGQKRSLKSDEDDASLSARKKR